MSEVVASTKASEPDLENNLLAKTDSLGENELVASNPQQKNWKGIVLALLVILFISGIIIIASVLSTQVFALYNAISDINHGNIVDTFSLLTDSLDHDYGTQLNFDDLVTNNNIYRKFQVESYMYGKYFVWRDPPTGLRFFDTEAGTEGLIDMNRINEVTFLDPLVTFQVPSNLGFEITIVGNHLVIFHYHNQKFRGSSSGGLGNLIPIGSNKGSYEQPMLFKSVADPTGQRIAFVDLQYQLYYQEKFFNRSETILTHVTKGLPSENFQYAYPDWLYMEEIFEVDRAMWWSPDGMKLAFAAFDEKNTKSINITLFKSDNSVYGQSVNIKYPKAGDLNQKNVPLISFYVHGVKTKETRLIPKPNYIPEDAILSFVKWITDDVLLLSYLDRPQVTVWLLAVSWTTNTTWKSKENNKEPIALPEENKFLIILPQEDKIGFRAIASLDLYVHEGRAVDHISAMTWIHRPKYDIMDIYLKNGDDIFYKSSGPNPMEMHLFWFNKNLHRIDEAVCLSCNNTNCTYNEFLVAPNAKYTQWICRGPDIYRASIFELKRIDEKENIHSYKLDFVKYLKDLPKEREQYKKHKLPRVEFHELVLRANTSDELKVNAKVLLPPELDKSHITQYPLLLFTYAGPSTQMVKTDFKPDWREYMVTRLRTIIMMVDGRGTSGRGRGFETSVYKHLGDYEIADQLEAVKVFASKNKYVNQSQIGAFGWSYGGFTVGHLLGHPRNELIRCGVSVAPVTNFKLYGEIEKIAVTSLGACMYRTARDQIQMNKP
ncbi:Inactive dipeptidyl peptidase 10 [Cichlidogyrus casuarinus]|uniref:Inactive dipeptidyl peptidase 10 n=1 Tax=Cichlidogyrus casuarinus TaxID=1844966 RepID=A0ABD2PVQ3_9PLAT